MQSIDAEKSSRQKKFLRLVPLIFGLEMIAFLDRTNISYATLTMSKDMHFTAAIFGLGAGIFFIGYLIFQIPTSVKAEKKSAKNLIFVMVVGWGIIAMITSFVNTAWQFYLLRFSLGACEAGLLPVLIIYISRWFVVKERATVISILIASTSLSLIIMGPISTQIISNNWLNLEGWRWLFILEALPAILIGPVIYFGMPDRPGKAKWLNSDEKKWIESQLDMEAKAKSKQYSYSWRQALRDRDAIKLLTTYSLWLAASYSLVFFFPMMINETAKLSLTTIGYVGSATWAVGFAALIIVGRSSDKRNERKMHMFVPLIITATALGLVMLFHASGISAIILLVIAVSSMGAGYGILWNLPTLFLSETSAAVFLGTLGTIGNIGSFFGPTVTGYLKTATGSFTDSNIVILVMFLAASFLILTLKKNKILPSQVPTN